MEGSELVVDPGPGYVQAGKEKEKGKGKQKQKKQDGEGAAPEDTKYIKRKGQGRRKAKLSSPSDDETPPLVRPDSKSQLKNPDTDLEPRLPAPPTIRVVSTDTLTAAYTLLSNPRNRSPRNPCILNMASPLRPGGGLLAGATSQEEFLCARTTLLPALRDTFYRLPEHGAIFTRDVLVFRNCLPLDDPKGEIPVAERWYVDVVSAGMLRFPDLEGDEEVGEGRLGVEDRRGVEAKMRAVMRVVVGKGARKAVLGAWGCGAYGNPVADVAEAWRAVLVPGAEADVSASSRGKAGRKVETWEGLEEVVFAIGNRKMAQDFAREFGGVEVEEGPGSREEEEGDEVDEVAEELRAKIEEMEGQVEKVWNAELKQRMSVILEGLRAQLREREGKRGDSGGEGEGSSGDGEISDAAESEASGVGLSANEVNVVHYSSDDMQVSPFD